MDTFFSLLFLICTAVVLIISLFFAIAPSSSDNVRLAGIVGASAVTPFFIASAVPHAELWLIGMHLYAL